MTARVQRSGARAPMDGKMAVLSRASGLHITTTCARIAAVEEVVFLAVVVDVGRRHDQCASRLLR